MEQNKNIAFERIYIHYPFCKRFCYYCDFYKEKYDNVLEKRYIKNLQKEIEYIKEKYKLFPLSSLYIGGGSPSLASPSFFDLIFSHFSFKKNLEVSIEINIEDISLNFLNLLKNYPFNRISIGIQNFVENYSFILGRKIDNKLTLRNLEISSKFFENISIDLLILGFEKDEFKKNIKYLKNVLKDFNIKHISLYILTLYEKTYLAKNIEKIIDNFLLKNIKKGSKQNLNKKDLLQRKYIQRKYIDYTYIKYQEYLDQNNFLQYEVSNFAKPNFLCNHNLAYWIFENYLGLGPSAVSLYKKNGKFISKINQKNLNFSSYEEEIPLETYLYFRFRSFLGVPYRYLKNKENTRYLDEFLKKNLIKIENKNLKITQKGYLLLDYIFDKLFL